MKIIDPHHPIFAKTWVRVLTVVTPALWALVEIYFQAYAWALLFIAASGYAAYELLIMYDKRVGHAPPQDKGPGEQ